MQIPISEAKGQLTELVRQAEGGDEIVLTRHGHPAVRLVPVLRRPDKRKRRAVLEEIYNSAGAKALNRANKGPSAARSQDFLYDKNGLPK